MQRLDAFIALNKDRIVERWLEVVRGGLHSAAMPEAELVNQLPLLLDELEEALRRDHAAEQTQAAPIHGQHRLRLGFSLPSVVHEYGALQRTIIELARADGFVPSETEYDLLFDSTITAIADAVGQYTRQRDAEMQRHANEHFAFVAHELRNPLMTAQLAFARLDAARAEAPVDNAVQVVRRSLERVRTLIDESLAATRVAAGVDVRLEPVSLRSLVEDACADIHDAATMRDVHVDVQAESDESVELDARLIRSAVYNLLQNAVKFTRVGGTVELRATVHGQLLTIECEDECGGLDPGFAERAIAPFFQMNRDHRGYGLGLAIVRQAVDAHGGTMRVQDLPGKGCLFVLEIPIAAQDAAGTVARAHGQK